MAAGSAFAISYQVHCVHPDSENSLAHVHALVRSFESNTGESCGLYRCLQVCIITYLFLIASLTVDASTPWRLLATYSVPNLPACPPDGCICAVRVYGSPSFIALLTTYY